MFTIQGHVYLTCHHHWLQCLKFVMKISCHVLSSADTLSRHTVKIAVEWNIVYKLQYLPLPSTDVKSKYKCCHLCLSPTLDHVNWDVLFKYNYRYVFCGTHLLKCIEITVRVISSHYLTLWGNKDFWNSTTDVLYWWIDPRTNGCTASWSN